MSAGWLDRPPTAEEVRAHAAAHPCLPEGARLCAWQVILRGEAPCIAMMWVDEDGVAMIDLGDERICPVSYAASIYAGARWLPITGEKLPVGYAPMVAPGARRVCNDCDEEVRPDNSCGCPDAAEPTDTSPRHDDCAPSTRFVDAICALSLLAADDPAKVDRRRADDIVAGAIHAYENERPTELEMRLLAAMRSSGMPLGKLLVLANEGAAVGLYGIEDVRLVEMCERWVIEHPRRAQAASKPKAPMAATGYDGPHREDCTATVPHTPGPVLCHMAMAYERSLERHAVGLNAMDCPLVPPASPAVEAICSVGMLASKYESGEANRLLARALCEHEAAIGDLRQDVARLSTAIGVSVEALQQALAKVER